MDLPRRTPVLVLAALSACGSPSPTRTSATGETSTTAGPGQTTLTGSSSSTTTGTTSPATTDPGTTGDSCGGFVCSSDQGDDGSCDLFTQDCPDGEKCAPYDSDFNGAWDSTKCVPVTGDGVLNDPCTANPSSEGGDDCAKGYMCWNMDKDGMGACFGQCTGTPENARCADECTQCTLSGSGVLALCMPSCDPLEPDCVGESVCISSPNGPGFICVLDASGGAHPVGSACEFANQCNSGLICLDQNFYPDPDCEGAIGCCASFCNLSQGQGDQNPTCQTLAGDVPDVKCVPWFEDDPPPDVCFVTDVGVCGVPQP